MATLALVLLGVLTQDAVCQCWLDVACTGPTQASFTGPWDANIFASSTRDVAPANVLSWPDLITTNTTTVTGNGSLIVFDFGKEMGGLASFDWDSSGEGNLGVAFTEAKNFVGYRSDDSDGSFKIGDGALYTGNFDGGSGSYILPQQQLRGGFRYMSVFLLSNDTSTSVSVSNVSVTLDFQPNWSNLQAYQGYFQSSDPLLNRLWYAGAYTLQSNMVPTNTGRQIPALAIGWANNATLGSGDTIIVDGAKRDRAVWPGDMGVAVPSTFVSVGDLEPIKNALQVMYDTQNKTTGAFAESGPPLSQQGSDTYHMWTMIGTYNYFLYTNDTTFLSTNWPSYEHAMTFMLGKVQSETNLLNVTGLRDWGRLGQGGMNTEANMILYRTLITGSKLATWYGDQANAANWSSIATNLASSVSTQLFDTAYGAFKDNDTATTLHPQDANALSLYFSLPESANVSSSIADRLTNNWTPIGPVAPELPDNISPFISSFELLGRFNINSTDSALQLLRTTWGWIINNANSTESTIIEGYLANGSFGYRNYDGYDYDTSYVSHAHGWSTGPTSALTNYVLGLDVTGPAGSKWSLAPQIGDLTSAEGGFTTVLGQFSAMWTLSSDGTMFNVNWTVPSGTTGTVTLPTLSPGSGQNVTASVNGVPMDMGKLAADELTAADQPRMSFQVDGGVGQATVA